MCEAEIPCAKDRFMWSISSRNFPESEVVEAPQSMCSTIIQQEAKGNILCHVQLPAML